MELHTTLVASAFIAGILMFLAPCTLPLIPAFLAFISGTNQEELQRNGRRAHVVLFVNALAFTIGFSIVFISFGVLAGLFGTFVGPFRGILTQVGGVFIVFLGLLMLDIVRVPQLAREHKLQLPVGLKPGRPESAFLVGATFALGWTPCVGPVLASVLLLASTSTTVVEGTILLTVFSFGLAIPFLLTALLYGSASRVIAAYASFAWWVQKIGGAFLILIGFLLLTGQFGLMVQYGYKLFYLFGLQAFFDYL